MNNEEKLKIENKILKIKLSEQGKYNKELRQIIEDNNKILNSSVITQKETSNNAIKTIKNICFMIIVAFILYYICYFFAPYRDYSDRSINDSNIINNSEDSEISYKEKEEGNL